MRRWFWLSVFPMYDKQLTVAMQNITEQKPIKGTITFNVQLPECRLIMITPYSLA